MPLILGIDAAWTPHGSSGVALLEATEIETRLVACAPSYAAFLTRAEKAIDPTRGWLSTSGGALNARELLRAAETLGKAPVDIVTIDMPVSRVPFEGRRGADNAVSKAFGSAGASTHSPSRYRPGKYGESIARQFADAGYTLATEPWSQSSKCLIEAYPLAALVRIMRLEKRPCYKANRRYKCWSKLSRPERIQKILEEWSAIASALDIEGMREWPRPASGTISHLSRLKPFEDAWDAIVCGKVGACYARRDAEPFGDHSAATWIPVRTD
jgi:predicted RNase H-like nuclease